MFSKDVRVFRRAVLWFSVSGVVYGERTAVVFDYMRDTLIEFARNVIIQVPNHVARFVKARLYFDARWLMISEVRFESGTQRLVEFHSVLRICVVRIIKSVKSKFHYAILLANQLQLASSFASWCATC